MRVGFNACLLSSPNTRGLNRYLVNLLTELGSLGTDLYLYSDRQIHPSHLERLVPGSFTARSSASMRYPIWEQHWLPRQSRADKIDILHSTHNFGLPWFTHCPRVLTLHDAIFHVRAKDLTARQRYSIKCLIDRCYHWAARSSANHIITVSNYSRCDLIDLLGIAPGRITVTHEAADPLFHASVSDKERQRIRARYKLDKRYIFYTGGWESRKNVPFLLQAFAAASPENVDLVLAGEPHGVQRTNVERIVAELGLGERVRLVGWVPDQDLPALYGEALCFVYPSEYEGFGLQLCEAMAMACPVFASRATSLTEVLGSGGDTFSLGDPSELMALLRRVAQDGNYRNHLAGRALMRSGELRWRSTAEKTLGVYENVLRRSLPAKAVIESTAG